jgi:Flp pilus assembly protein TadG
MSRSGRSSRVGDASGQVIVLVVVALVGLLGMSAMVIDLGYLYWNQRNLQASADAAALAGAMELPDAAASVNVAKQYGTSSTAKNTDSRVSNVDESITTKCITTIPGCDPVNAVVVDETATVNTFFMRVFGMNTAKVHVKATACSPCGSQKLDIVLVLDRTGSMCEDPAGNPDPACTDLVNSQNGMKTFLGYLDPTIDSVGYAVFPPARSVSGRCSPADETNYNRTTSPYVVVPLSSDYKNVDGSLKSSSNLVSTINCTQAGGRTSYANAIEAAQGELDAHGRADAQHVVVFLSDGAANIGPTYYLTSSPYRKQPCHQGITSAGVVKAKGTVVYSIGYAIGDDGGCLSYTGSSELPAITAQEALTGIASPGNFYSRPTPGQLNSIYGSIAKDIGRGHSSLTSDG